ncbi:MAG: hypothetical protein RJQ04_16395 [Longimicrobiales bacterium]
MNRSPTCPIRAWTRRTAVAGLVLLAAACSDPAVPDDEPTYSGRVVDVLRVDGGSADGVMRTVWVRPDGDPCGVRFRVRSDTEIWVGSRRGGPDDLVPGGVADVWFDGVVAASCPGQAGADVVRVR